MWLGLGLDLKGAERESCYVCDGGFARVAGRRSQLVLPFHAASTRIKPREVGRELKATTRVENSRLFALFESDIKTRRRHTTTRVPVEVW